MPTAFTEEGAEESLFIADGLRSTIPAPAVAQADLQELEQESSRHRVLLIRGGAVIAITTLLSIGAALLIHTMLAGVFVLGYLFPSLPDSGGGGRGGDADQDAAGGGQVIVLPDLADAAASPAPSVADLLSTPAASIGKPAPAPLPPLPESTAASLSADPLSTPDIPLPPLPTSDLGTLRPPIKFPAQAQLPDYASPLRVAPPGGTAVSARGPTAGAGAPEGSEIADEDRVNLLKGDGSGTFGGLGSGRGRGSGNGLDRGFSAGNRDAQILQSGLGDFTPPLKYQLHPPDKPTILYILVKANGQIGSVTVAASCGFQDLDEMVRVAALVNLKYSPAIRNGKAVDSTNVYEYGK